MQEEKVKVKKGYLWQRVRSWFCPHVRRRDYIIIDNDCKTFYVFCMDCKVILDEIRLPLKKPRLYMTNEISNMPRDGVCSKCGKRRKVGSYYGKDLCIECYNEARNIKIEMREV